MIHTTGLLTEIHEQLCKSYPIMNQEYLYQIAESLLSSVCWTVWLRNNYGWLQPNVWNFSIFQSGRGKTLPIDNFLVKVLKIIESKLSTEKEKYSLIIGEYTHESGIFLMSNQAKYHKHTVIGNVGIICQDENSLILNACHNVKYMAGVMETDSKIYDRYMAPRFTIGRGFEELEYVYKAKISASTPRIYELFKNNDLIQGGQNRTDVMVHLENEVIVDEILPEGFLSNVGYSKIVEQENSIINIAEKLHAIASSDVKIIIFFDDKAELMWRNYELEMRKLARSMPIMDLRAGYVNRQAEKALKRAMLNTISRFYTQIINEPVCKFEEKDNEGNILNTFYYKTAVCEESEMVSAIANQREYYKYFQEFLKQRDDYTVEPESKSSTDFKDRAWLKSSLRGFGIVSDKWLHDKTGWNPGNPKWYRNIDWAVENKYVHKIWANSEESIKICREHEGDDVWFKKMKISPKFKTSPVFYEWIEDKDGGEI